MTGKPHVLWVNHFAAAPDMGGGTRHFELGRELVRMGWDVTVAASDFHLHRRMYLRRKTGDDRSAIPESIDDVRFLWIWAAPYAKNDLRRIRNWLSFSATVWRHDWAAKRPDVIIGSSPHLFVALAAQRAAKRLGVPFVLEVRDLWPETLALQGGRRGPGYHALGMLARFLYRKADRIVVLTEGVRAYLIQRGLSADRISTVSNGVDVAAFKPVARRDGSSLRLIYAGAHGPANGLDTVLDAASILSDDSRVSFVLMGDGPSKPALKARAQSMGLKNVEFAEPVSKTEIPSALGQCDAGLMVLKDLPLFSFGVSPNKLFDYWAARLPIICNVPGETSATVEEAKGGVVARATTAQALAESVRQLAEMPPQERTRMGLLGREWVERERGRPLLASKLDAVLRALVPRVERALEIRGEPSLRQ